VAAGLAGVHLDRLPARQQLAEVAEEEPPARLPSWKSFSPRKVSGSSQRTQGSDSELVSSAIVAESRSTARVDDVES
jgi:hypothetical protein